MALYNTAAAGAQPGSKAVAGYLFGLSGELAVKAMMRSSGMKPRPQGRRDDPFYAHFPALKTQLRDSAQGRRSGDLRKLAADERLFQNWDTDMRYAPTQEIQIDWIETWMESAKILITEMEF